MNSSLFNDATLYLETAARDFQRAVDQQIATFNQERDLHERAMEELNKKITSVKQTLSELEEKQHNKEDNLKSSIEEIDIIQKEIESLKVVVLN